MSGPAVVIGYLFLIPSILGMLFGVFALFATGSAASGSGASIEKQARAKLQEAAIPEAMISSVVTSKPLGSTQLETLSQKQRSAILETQATMAASKIGAGAGSVIAGGLFIGLIIASFVGGLLGWLLIMKKWVLQCTTCSATVAAS